MSKQFESQIKFDPTPENNRLLGFQVMGLIVVLALDGFTYIFSTPGSQFREALILLCILSIGLAFLCGYNLIRGIGQGEFLRKNWVYIICGGLSINMLVTCAKFFSK